MTASVFLWPLLLCLLVIAGLIVPAAIDRRKAKAYEPRIRSTSLVAVPPATYGAAVIDALDSAWTAAGLRETPSRPLPKVTGRGRVLGDGMAFPLSTVYAMKDLVKLEERVAAGLQRQVPVGLVRIRPLAGEPGRAHLIVSRSHPLGSQLPYPVLPGRRPPGGRGFSVTIGQTEFLRPLTIDLQKTALWAGQNGSGKALDVATPLPTPNGWTTMGAVRTGDMVYGSDGAPCRVVSKSPVRADRECFSVMFSDGEAITCDADHLWSVSNLEQRQSASSRRNGRRRIDRGTVQSPSGDPIPAVLSLTTAELLRRGVLDGRRAGWSVAVARPVRGVESVLPVGPYTLGVWLGDGNCRDGHITQDPADAAPVVAAMALEGHEARPVPSTPLGWRVIGLTAQLRQLGVLGAKRIPAMYLTASVGQRAALLRGLMDTDGHCARGGKVELSFSSRELIDDARELVCSLGHVVGQPRAHVTTGQVSWRLTWTPPEVVFGLPRKAERQSFRGVPRCRTIRAIEPVEPVPVQCITVDSPNHLYLCGRSFVPTHNTWGVVDMMLAAATFPNVEMTVYDASIKGGSGYAPFGPRLRHGGVLKGRRQIFADIAKVEQSLARRAKLLDGQPYTPTAKLPLRLVIIEEFPGLIAEDDDLETIIRLAQQGREFGLSLQLVAQNAHGTIVDTVLRAELRQRLAFRMAGWREADMALGEGVRGGDGEDGWTPIPDAWPGVLDSVVAEETGVVRSRCFAPISTLADAQRMFGSAIDWSDEKAVPNARMRCFVQQHVAALAYPNGAALRAPQAIDLPPAAGRRPASTKGA